MTTTIITKNSSTAGGVPLAADLTAGELAINLTDKRLFSKLGSTVFEVGTNPSAIALANGTGLPIVAGTTGTLSTARGGTNLTSFTANGVVYASSTSALATGSALTFDGTSNLSLGIASTILSAAGRGNMTINGSTDSIISFGNNGSNSAYIYSSDTKLEFDAAGTRWIQWNTNGSEAMRLTSTGLGIGTSSPDAKLTVYGNAPAFTMQTSRSFTVNRNWQLGVDQFNEGNWTLTPSTTLGGTTYTTPAITITASGNLGLGFTPSAWVDDKALQLPQGAISSGYDYGISVTSVCYRTSSNAWLYKVTGQAPTRYHAEGGSFKWFTAPSGTAGTAITFTQALTLDASGRLLVGLTSATSTNANIQTNKPINLAGYTVATLPSGTLGDIAYVTDALAPTFLGTIVGGGAIKTPVFYNGTNWVAH